jgi:hypothetical protein
MGFLPVLLPVTVHALAVVPRKVQLLLIILLVTHFLLGLEDLAPLVPLVTHFLLELQSRSSRGIMNMAIIS